MDDRDRVHGPGAFLRRPATFATVAGLSLALVLGGLAWNATRPTDDGNANASHPPGTTSPGPSLSDDPWASLEPTASIVPPVPANDTATGELAAQGTAAAVVPLDVTFRLASIDATPASTLATRLSIHPDLAFSVAPDADDRAVVITPDEPLLPGVVYRFALNGAGGQLLDSWAFQAEQPLRIVGTLPEDRSPDVPTDTGIEVTFDQDGFTDAESHFRIEPTTKGRFEQHGRTLAFVPDRRLKAATTYTVTVTKGVTVAATGEATERDTRFQFETAATSTPVHAIWFDLSRDLLESPTAERPVIGLSVYFDEEGQSAPKSTRIEVYRLANLDAAIEAHRTVRAAPDWTRWSKEGIVDTTKLRRVVSVNARLEGDLEPYGGTTWARLPKRLPAGWYLVQLPDSTRPRQAVLQVTDVAGYLVVSETRTLVWANDLKRGHPVKGATVSAGTGVIGTTDANGLATGPTPKDLLPAASAASGSCSDPCDPVVTVKTADGRAIFLPTTSDHDKGVWLGGSYYGYYGDEGDPAYWSLLHTDRDLYRPTDTVNIWGMVRDRDDGTVPETATLRLALDAWYEGDAWVDGPDRPPVASLTARPGPTGAFTASLPLTALADGYYSIELLVGDRILRTSTIEVGPIAKPAYQLEVTTGRRVYIADDRIKVTVKASFFEGTPVAGVPLRTDGYLERNLTTDATGTATYRTTAKTEYDEGPDWATINVNPARAEEGEINGASRSFLIFPSSRTVEATARIANDRVAVNGSVHLVDVDRLEAEVAAVGWDWDLDPRGAAVRGATVTVRFVELIPVRTKTGTEYDFIEKKVVPVYEDRIVERSAGSVKVKSAANGSYKASIRATRNDHDYRVSVSVGDPDGNVARTSTYANRHAWSSFDDLTDPILDLTAPAPDGSDDFGIGDRVDLTFTDPDLKQARGDGTRYLFFTAQRGLRDATVQSSKRFVTTFKRWAVPNMEVGSVRFTGHGYVAAGFAARFRTSDRSLQVDLTSGAARYAPGDTATVGIRTRDASGVPIPATVILRAVDEKLFAMGAASADDPLSELYASLDSGIVGIYASHEASQGHLGGEGGDTTGGGGPERVQFKDTLLFASVDTDANGRGSVSFKLSDDLTSWRVSASAITAGLDAGAGTVLVPVGLPFFADASIAPEYLLADRPSIPVRVFGSAVEPGDAVTIRVTSKTLGFDSGPIKGQVAKTILVPLPALHLGTQTVTISARSGSGATARTDRLTRSFLVVETRLTRSRTAYVALPATGALAGGDGLTTVVVSDASAGRYLPLLTELADGGGARLDRGLAAESAAALLASRFGSVFADPVGGTFDASLYYTEDGGLSLMPYSSTDLELTALAALTAPDRVGPGRLAEYFRTVRDDPKETRERKMFALAGLAGLAEPVLPAIRAAAADPELTIREQLMIGLGAAALGDDDTARSVASALVEEYGERLGDQARLRVGSSADDVTSATALMAVLTAALGEELAPAYWAYVDANPAADQLQVLPAVAFVTETLERLPVQPASFAYSVDGVRREVSLEPATSFEFRLTASQMATLSIEPVTGKIGVATSWREPVRPSALKPDPDITISRSVRPSTVDSADLVTVSLTVEFGRKAPNGCHQVTELVPSGLLPVGTLAGWVDPEGEDEPGPSDGIVSPYDQSGPRVFFCAEPTAKDRTVVLRYYARVVTPGTYAWEPAVAESRSQDGRASLTPARKIVIR